MNLDQTDHMGAILFRVFCNICYLKHNQTERTKQKCQTGQKKGKFVYLTCPINPLKGPELSTLNFARRTLVFGVSWPGITQNILNSYMVRSDSADA